MARQTQLNMLQLGDRQGKGRSGAWRILGGWKAETFGVRDVLYVLLISGSCS